MTLLLLVGTVGCVLANAFEVAAKIAKAQFVLQNASEVGVPRRWIPSLAFLEGAGTAGVILGLLGLPWLGVAAAAGLVLFFVGAVTAHVRAGVLHNIAFPATFLLLAIVALGHFVAVLV
ncbi:DoxX family protein [Cryptosporangium sp. NPDC048952]|uniref:DoxX family protein n=1 Tax=Cryptosporangium sp. NPDC048952 TaxID=3363961 RepID=UPI0037151A4E